MSETLTHEFFNRGMDHAIHGTKKLDKDKFDKETVFDYWYYYDLGYREVVEIGYK